ncbi:MAG: hypothetical protein ABEJ40_09640 [Haloarculaceae archaeon]
MSGWSPPSLPRAWLVGLGVLFALFFGYSLLVQSTVLLALVPAVVVGAAYYLWRLLVAVEATADAVHRLADRGERERG